MVCYLNKNREYTMSVTGIICLLFILHVAHSADTKYMKNSIKKYFSDTRHHAPQFRAYKKAAKDYIFSEFVRYGLRTEYHTFQDTTVSQNDYFQSVIGVLKGERFGTVDDKILGLGAHYDTMDTTKGVDDNGAGVAALLEVARQLTDMNNHGISRKNTIFFVAFDLEEYGYRDSVSCRYTSKCDGLETLPLSGSRHLIEEWFPQFQAIEYNGVLPDIQGVIILDTMMEFNTSARSQNIPPEIEPTFATLFPSAYNSIKSDDFRGDFLNLFYRLTTKDFDLAKEFIATWNNEGRPNFELESFPLSYGNLDDLDNFEKDIAMNFLRSDHANFWVRDIPAIWLTDSANFRGDMIQCYHNMCDNLQVMLTEDNINFLGKTADTIANTLHKLSLPSGVYTDTSNNKENKGKTSEEQPPSFQAGVGTGAGIVFIVYSLVVFAVFFIKRNRINCKDKSQTYEEPKKNTDIIECNPYNELSETIRGHSIQA